jgi:hypothetical protein
LIVPPHERAVFKLCHLARREQALCLLRLLFSPLLHSCVYVLCVNVVMGWDEGAMNCAPTSFHRARYIGPLRHPGYLRDLMC